MSPFLLEGNNVISVNETEWMFEQKYRPQTLEECILPDSDMKIFKKIVAEGKVPHLILQSNSPGTGKTTIAKVLGKETDSNVLFVNGSDCRIDYIRNELTAFASSSSLSGGKKLIIIDEFDRPGLAEAQRHMRTFMEAYSRNCSVIITANNLEGIIKPLQSRARVIKFGTPSAEESKNMMKRMILRCKEICENEKIPVEDLKVLASLVKRNFPDFRKTVNDLDMYSKHGKIDSGILSIINHEDTTTADVIDALKTKNVKELKVLAIKYSSNFSVFTEKLVSDMYPLLNNASIIRMYQIIGESNQFFGLAANVDIHITYMLIQLAVEMTWK